MDPISQAVIGASFSQSHSKAATKMPLALVAGIIGGMAPDLDVLIRSSSDPLLAIQFHRHFTHSLFFVPFGGAIVGAFLYFTLGAWSRRSENKSGKTGTSRFGNGYSLFDWIFFSTLGFASHGLLDACTSYGTQLLWPFSNLRVAWNNIGIIDPVPTLTWLIGAVLAYRTKSVRPARIALAIGVAYLVFGVFQRERADDVQADLVKRRGHEAVRREVKPTILQLFLWKSIYEYNGRYFSDAIYVGPFSNRVYQSSAPEGLLKFEVGTFPKLESKPDSILEADLKRFAWFSDDWLARVPQHEAVNQMVIGDIRYSLLPQEIDPLWGIRFDQENYDAHVEYVTFRNVTDRKFGVFRKMLLGQDLE
ncbi:MAG: metal-dependent hydrolase [Bdellovibrionales bacterium]|nr:metal-dependent hydrolase [Bdellovibrionales bacterium]